MAVDQVANKGLSGQMLNSDPANGAVAVTPSDTNDIGLDGTARAVSVNSKPCRALYVGGTGNLKVTMADGTVVTFASVPVGLWPFRVRQVFSTLTTATNIVALY